VCHTEKSVITLCIIPPPKGWRAVTVPHQSSRKVTTHSHACVEGVSLSASHL
jgi:hypothetical protein